MRAKRREALAQLDTLLQSTFLDMFGDPVTNPMGWERKPLVESIIRGTREAPGLEPDDFDKVFKDSGRLPRAIPYLANTNVRRDTEFDLAALRISDEHFSESDCESSNCENGDLRSIGVYGGSLSSCLTAIDPLCTWRVIYFQQALACPYVRHRPNQLTRVYV